MPMLLFSTAMSKQCSMSSLVGIKDGDIQESNITLVSSSFISENKNGLGNTLTAPFLILTKD